MCTLFALSESIRMLEITAKYIILPDLINPDLNNVIHWERSSRRSLTLTIQFSEVNASSGAGNTVNGEHISCT